MESIAKLKRHINVLLDQVVSDGDCVRRCPVQSPYVEPRRLAR